MLNAGGGPFEVSIPWLLRDAGALLFAGERASIPDAPGCGRKYDPALASGIVVVETRLRGGVAIIG